jgi:hypothetical protein
MNELYNETITRRGKTYRYDPDADCYYRAPVKLSKFDRYAWLAVIAILSAITIYFEWY